MTQIPNTERCVPTAEAASPTRRRGSWPAIAAGPVVAAVITRPRHLSIDAAKTARCLQAGTTSAFPNPDAGAVRSACHAACGRP